MRNLFLSLKKKPKHVRSIYAFCIAFVVTGVIAGFWVTTLPARFAQTSLSESHSAEAGMSFSSLKNSFQQFFANIGSITSETTYHKEPSQATSTTASQSPHMIDLNALVASSTQSGTSSMDIYATDTAPTTAETATNTSQ